MARIQKTQEVGATPRAQCPRSWSVAGVPGELDGVDTALVVGCCLVRSLSMPSMWSEVLRALFSEHVAGALRTLRFGKVGPAFLDATYFDEAS